MPNHIAKAGQTFTELTERHFDNKDLAKHIAEMNKLPVDKILKDGQEIYIPDHLYSMGKCENTSKGSVLHLNFHKIKVQSKKTIRILDESGNPLPGAHFSVRVNGNEMSKGQLDSTGSAEIETESDNYSIVLLGA